MKSDGFRQAAEAKDFSRAEELFSPDVVFHSPAVYEPYSGLEALGVLLRNVAEVFEDFRYVDQVESGDTAVLIFEARVGDREVNGVDILRFGEDERIAEMTVMIRPFSGLQALLEEMGRRLSAASG
ncbi:MAG TPA: nuclear transport factor 2 family protein [Solirubrobacterales bacterium]|nr:nuclear transport factor 2 family protein [Solirubrobacterales bacterium]